MAEGFAGARSLDDRRRRRLAGAAIDTAADTPASLVTAALVGEPPADTQSERGPLENRYDNRSDFPLARLISQKKWKLAGAILSVVLTTVGLVMFGQSEKVLSAAYGENLSRIFMLPNGSAFRFGCCFLMIGTAQLAYTIGWVRSRNPRDFGGHYRIWRWAAAFLFIGAVCISTGLHHAIGDLVAHLLERRYPYCDVLNWLLPFAILSFPIVMKVIHDMSNCRLSTALFSMTVVAGLTVAIAPIFNAWEVTATTLVTARLIVCCSAFCSLLIHTWYVLHVSSEPPSQSSVLRSESRRQSESSIDDSLEDGFPVDGDSVEFSEVEERRSIVPPQTTKKSSPITAPVSAFSAPVVAKDSARPAKLSQTVKSNVTPKSNSSTRPVLPARQATPPPDKVESDGPVDLDLWDRMERELAKPLEPIAGLVDQLDDLSDPQSADPKTPRPEFSIGSDTPTKFGRLDTAHTTQDVAKPNHPARSRRSKRKKGPTKR